MSQEVYFPSSITISDSRGFKPKSVETLSTAKVTFIMEWRGG